jgi:phospholipase C
MHRPGMRLFALALLAVLSGCGQHHHALTFSPVPLVPNQPLVQSPIQHVVIIVQENRSFDNLFHGFPGADSNPTVPLSPIALENAQDVCHFHTSFEAAYDHGKLDGFDNEQLCSIIKNVYQPAGVSHFMYSYVVRAELQPYWTLAQTYTIADRMFQSNAVRALQRINIW